MPISARKDLLRIGGICCAFAALGWVLYGVLFSFAPAQDFMVFYTAARACIEGHLSLIFDGDAFTAQLNARFGAWFSRPLDFHPWMYPPPFLLLMIPVGFLPFAAAYAVFLIVAFLSLNCAIRCYAPPGYQRWLCAVSLALSPATAFTVAVGQNGFLTSALLVGGFGLMGRSPWLAGALLGLLAFKPQLWILVPVALVAAREWKTLSGAIAAMAVGALTSVAVLGVAPWRAWLTLMLTPSPTYRHWLEFGRLNGQSIYADAVLLGAPAGIASGVQLLATLSCAALVWWCFRVSGMARDLQLAVLLTATILAAPHVSNYDAVMLAVAVSLFMCRGLEYGFRFGDATLIVIVWTVELLNPPRMIPWGLLTPLLLCLFLAAVIRRRREGALGAMASPGTPRRPSGLRAAPSRPPRRAAGTVTGS